MVCGWDTEAWFKEKARVPPLRSDINNNNTIHYSIKISKNISVLFQFVVGQIACRACMYQNDLAQRVKALLWKSNPRSLLYLLSDAKWRLLFVKSLCSLCTISCTHAFSIQPASTLSKLCINGLSRWAEKCACCKRPVSIVGMTTSSAVWYPLIESCLPPFWNVRFSLIWSKQHVKA